MTKLKFQDCKVCGEQTWHRVKKKGGLRHTSGGGGFTKYRREHCTTCNFVWYDGKRRRDEPEKSQKFISIR